ncbi:MAG: DUF4389 domain-containing protein [Gammaproteobacteria bacterium]|jgi:hypothetical protein|nr:DUF4389 domain-containing protein [Gammaproteobacteria bacterium]
MKEEMRENLIDEGIWMRGLFMVLFLIAYNIVEFLILLVALFQFVAVLFTGRVNETVLRLGNNLSLFALETFQYLTFNSNLRPFPFSPWPDEEPGGDLWRDNDIAEAEFEDVKADRDDNVKNVDS